MDCGCCSCEPLPVTNNGAVVKDPVPSFATTTLFCDSGCCSNDDGGAAATLFFEFDNSVETINFVLCLAVVVVVVVVVVCLVLLLSMDLDDLAAVEVRVAAVVRFNDF